MFTRTLKEAQWALFLNSPISATLGFLTSFSGVVLYAVYKDCDPVSAGKITTYDKIMPYYVVEKVSEYPGFPGLFVSGIFSASLSTISALLNSLAAIALEDYVKPIHAKLGNGAQMSDARVTLVGKTLCWIIGFICLAIAFAAKHLGPLIQVSLAIAGAIGGPILGIFTLGMFVECANEVGAVAGEKQHHYDYFENNVQFYLN